jgi:hypothetical protein
MQLIAKNNFKNISKNAFKYLLTTSLVMVAALAAAPGRAA